MPHLEGLPTIYGIHPHETSEDQKHQLGTKGISADGRVYRYAQNAGTEIGPGLLCVAPDITALHEDVAVNTFAVGDTTLTVTIGATAIVAGEYEEGFVNIVDETGQGIMYGIANCPAHAGTGDVIVRLSEPVRVAAAAATTVTLIRNKYRDLRVSDVNQIDMPVGVMNVTLAADYYGWLQVKGPCSILVDGNDTTAGNYITNGDTTAGAVETRNAFAEPIVGIQPIGNNSDTTEYGSYELMLDY